MIINWREATRQQRCPICGHDSWCRLSADGAWAICRRADTGEGEHRLDRNQADYWLYRLDGGAGVDPTPWEPDPRLPCADEATRDRVYQFLLRHLTLTPAHRDVLIQRGLSEEAIRAQGYRTLPRDGRSAMAKALLEEFNETILRTIPGAYVKTENGRSWWSWAGAPGLLIPVRNVAGQIVALKVRADDPKLPRYSTISSRQHGGAGPGALIHVPLHDEAMDTTIVRITEGELKADVAHHRTGILTLAVPGVSNWRPVIPILAKLAAQRVLVAFDTDSRTNVHVKAALARTCEELAVQGLDVQQERWPEEWGKGIDDVLANGHVPIMADTSSPEPATTEPRSIFEDLHPDGDPERLIREVLSQPDTLGSLALAAETQTPEWERWLLELRDKGAKNATIESLKRSINALKRGKRGLRVAQAGERPEPRRIRDKIPNAPMPTDAIIPNGWALTPNGVFEEKRRIDPETGEAEVLLTPVAPVPIVITGRLRDVADGTESVRVEWWRDGRWLHTTVRRAVIASARALVDLADQGLPVTSNTASTLAQFLADLEAANLDILPRAQVSATLGWQRTDADEPGFLWGHTLLRPRTAPVTLGDLDGVAPAQWDRHAIAFHGADGGDVQVAEAFHEAGTLDTWKAAITRVTPHPRAMVAIYGALTAPCLALLGSPNYIMDWAFTTSTGKTTALRMAASVWGNPDERDMSSVLGTWDVTRVWIERMSAVLNGLPLILDDTKRARHPKLVSQTLYDVASGRGRGRGTPRGMQRAGSWTTVLLSTGESPAVQFTQDGGTRARTITLWGGPFGRPTPESARLVTQLDNDLRTNYGHAGPQFVQWLMDRQTDWEAWRVLYRSTQAVYQERAGDNSVAVRFAAYFAAMEVVAQLAHQALDLRWDWGPILDAAWVAAVEESHEADRALQALAAVVTWAELNATTFWGRHFSDYDTTHTPHGGWSGKWDPNDDWTTLGVAPQRIQDILTKAGWDGGEIDGLIRTWRDREWLEVDNDRKRYTKRMRVATESPRLVAIRRSAMESLI